MAQAGVDLAGQLGAFQLGDGLDHLLAIGEQAVAVEGGVVGGEHLGERLGHGGRVESRTTSASMVAAPSTSRVRAQSSVSETDGPFFRSIDRRERTIRTNWSVGTSGMLGTLLSTIAFSRSTSG